MATPNLMTDLSVTAASNSPAGSESPTAGDDFLRSIQAIIRRTNAKGSDIASATTTDIGAATAEFIDVTGTTTITGLGTIDAGIVRTVRFTGALTLTYNATSLILPASANITTSNGDMAVFRSLGSGNWVCVSYVRRDGTAISAPYLPLAGGTITGEVTFSASTLKLAKGVDVASATALPLITDGNYFDVTGTATITSFNSVGVGTWVRLHFDAALILTHNATDLVLPGGANITTAAGDEAEFIEYASGDWRCVSYTKANGSAIINQVVSNLSMVRLNTANGYGSTNTRIRRFTNTITNTGSDITYADSATLGNSFTINTSGIYAISYTEQYNTTGYNGISLNTTAPTSNIDVIPVAEILAIGTNGSLCHASWSGFLTAGAVIRAHTSGGASTALPTTITIVRVA